MKERPIIMTGHSVRAILDGRKTQTRRLVKGAPEWTTEAVPSLLAHDGDLFDFRGRLQNPKAIRCPHGKPGDRLWVREGFALASGRVEPDPEDPDDWTVIYRTEDDGRPWLSSLDEDAVEVKAPWKSPLFMPRGASRLTLEVTAVRCERLQDITEEDARAEGAGPADTERAFAYRDGFATLWDAINGKRAPWASNPWVWAISFRRVTP